MVGVVIVCLTGFGFWGGAYLLLRVAGLAGWQAGIFLGLLGLSALVGVMGWE